MTALSTAAAASIAALSTEANTTKVDATSVIFGAVKDVAGLAADAKGQDFFTAILEDGKAPSAYFHTTLALAEDLAGEITYNLVEAAYC